MGNSWAEHMVGTYMEDLPAGGSIVDDLLAEFTRLEIFGNIGSALD